VTSEGFVPGDSGQAIENLTANLVSLGLLAKRQDSYDSLVEAAIRALQQSRGLKVTGLCDPKTLQALEEARWKLGDRTLELTSPMMRGDDVATLQRKLLEMGFDIGKADGIFGPKSALGLKEFQKSVGIEPNGTCGPNTVIALMRLVRTVSGGTATALREDALRSRKGPSLLEKVVILDPSWGGSNPGHSFGDLRESDFTYDLSLRLSKRLKELGVTVHLTRDRDTSPTELERINYCNKVGGDLVISLHCDNYSNEKAEGVASFYFGNEEQGIKSVIGERFATLVQREIAARTEMLNCRTHAKSWDLLRLTKSPTVRVDIGYLSNPKDRARLVDDGFKDVVVEALVIAIQRLYLDAENDAKTGTLKVEDLRKAGIRQ
jgi:N-acetylmuramoyl-L-alanine amidase